MQSFVDFMGSRLHGRELSRLTVYLAPLSEIAARCAPGAVACYAPNLELLVGPGEVAVAAQQLEPGDEVAGDGLGAVPGGVDGEFLGG